MTQANPARNHDLQQLAREIRYDLVSVSHHTKTPHLASCLSAVDIMTVLYWKFMNLSPTEPHALNRDRFLLSKGHAASVLYTVLAHYGFYDRDELFEHGKTGSVFEEHPGVHAPDGVETVSGSLGHNLGIALGMAKGAKLRNQSQTYYVLMGDGEMNEGSVWEAAMLAPAQKLDNLVAIVDCNKWQGTGRSQDITALEPLDEKWRSFGWKVHRVNGHDHDALSRALTRAQQSAEQQSGKPTAIIADTVKGKGVSFMEDDNNWHYRIPTLEEVMTAAEELGVEHIER